MTDQKEKSISEYMKRGGFNGCAKQYLIDEIKKARKNKRHPLYQSLKAYKNNNLDESIKLFIQALLNAESYPLNMIATAFIKLPLNRLMLDEAIEKLQEGDFNEWNKFPAEIKVWSAMQIQRVEDEFLWLKPKQESLKKAIKAATKYTSKDKEKWNKLAQEMDPQGKLSNRSLARLIAIDLKLSVVAEQSIRGSISSQKERKQQKTG